MAQSSGVTGDMIIETPDPRVCRAVLWDLDGTLVDSSNHHFEAWRQTLAEEGMEISPERFVSTFGQRNDLVLRQFFGPDLPSAEIDRIAHAKESCFRDLVMSDGIAFLPGAERWLLALREAGWRQALATSAPRANVDAVLDALDAHDRFGAIVAAEDVTRGKPDPEVFQLAARQLRVADRCCIVVEDAPAGIEAAQRAGMPVVGVGDAARLSGADVHYSDLMTLPADLFERLASRSVTK
jgi:beta-phosphoglucomutase